MTSSTGENGRLSWEDARSSAPLRPPIATGAVEPTTLVDRPRRLSAAVLLVVIAVAVLIFAAFQILVNLGDARESLVTIMETELDEDYSSADMTLAANVLLGASWGGALLGAVIALISVCLIPTKQSRSARNWFVAMTLILVPAMAVTILLRDASGVDLVVSAGGLVLLCIAIVIVLTRRVTLWLGQTNHRERKPLVHALGS